MPYPQKLQPDFYRDTNVVRLARRCIGKVLVTVTDGLYTSGIITETEAYNGIPDKASHAYGGRRTARTEVMYSEGGIAYIYLCYGIHSLFNIVSGRRDDPHAILIRGILPLDGREIMEKRRGLSSRSKNFSSGPGTAAAALGLHYSASGTSLTGDTIWLEDRNIRVPSNEIRVSPRIGVDYAGEDALLPYRFLWHPADSFDTTPFRLAH